MDTTLNPFPAALSRAVFNPPGYAVPGEQIPLYLDALHDAWEQLPAQQREVMAYYYTAGSSYAAAARHFSMPVRRVRLAIQRGRHALRKAANPGYGEAVRRIGGPASSNYF